MRRDNEEEEMRTKWKRTGAVAGCFALLAVVLVVAVLVTPGADTPVSAQNAATPATGQATKSGKTSLYQDFLTKLAANLGITDPTKVDAAIKTTLTQMVDEQAAAGHIKQQTATTLKQRIGKGAFQKAFNAFLKSLEKHGHTKQTKTKKSPAPATPTLVGTPAV